jgi:outer membrane immunogenic protein
MIKRQLFAFASATLFGCSIATAADLAVRKAPPPPPPVFSWTGFYIGAHVGTGWGTTESEINSISASFQGQQIFNAAGFVIPVSQTQSNGFLGGIQGGYNWQLSPWAVIGVEADFSWTGIKGTSPCLVILACSTDHDWIATVAGRFGVTYDRALFYVKGGVAWAQTTYAASLNLGGLASFTTSVDETRVGALFGTGIEYAFLPGWSAKIEYNYIDFGTDDYNFPLAIGPIAVNVGTAIREKEHLVKAGLNYRFGSAY